MASALLASQNEPCWGERKVYMRKNPNPNPKATALSSISTNPNPNPKERPPFGPPSYAHAKKANESPAAEADAISENSSFDRRSVGLNHQRESDGGYVTFNVASYSKRERRDLKARLISELEQVRRFSCQIESGDFHSARSAGYCVSGNYGGGRDGASSMTRPPALQLNNLSSLDSSPLATGSDGGKEKRTPKANQHYRPSEFVTGKDGMVSPRSSDNNKKASGSKRPMPAATSPREAKRLAAAESEKLLSSMMKKCGQILTKLMKHKHGWVFNTPVDVDAMKLHDYHQIIKHPMDLGTVKTKLNKGIYSLPLEFAADVRLTFNNALLYNPKGHDVYIMAEQLINLFEGLFNPAQERYAKQQRGISRRGGEEEERQQGQQGSSPWSQMSTPEAGKRDEPAPASVLPAYSANQQLNPVAQEADPVPKPQPPPTVAARPAMGKQPKPKAKDPHKREMSLDEKQKLSFGLQSLPQEKMSHVLQIVRRRNPTPVQHGDEIELDFEFLDTETLWELDRFVCNCKKMMSKMRRQEAISGSQMSADAAPSAYVHKVQEEPPDDAAAKRSRKGEPGDEDVDIGEEMPTTHFPPVEIEKDSGCASRTSSSGSSSSGSSSSSSGSDSGSSSGSESDGESPAVGSRSPPRN